MMGSPGPGRTSQSASTRLTLSGIFDGTNSGTRTWPVGPTMVESAWQSWIAGLDKSPPQLPEWGPPSRRSIHRSIGKAPRVPSDMVGRCRENRGPSEAMRTSEANSPRYSVHSSRSPAEPVSSPVSISHLELKPSRPRADSTAALVVGDAAAVIPPVDLAELPRPEPGIPSGFEPADHVAMAVTEHRRQPRVFDALAEQKRTARLGMGQHPAAEAPRLQRRLHFALDVAAKLIDTFEVLALRRDRHPAGEIGREGPGVEIFLGMIDGGRAGHVAIFNSPWKMARAD